MASTTPEVSTANAPFNIPTADVVFRTSDNVDFRLGKFILRVASPFFDSMFSLTQPSDATSSNSNDPVKVPEDSKTFDNLMRYVYPVDDPQITDLDIVERVLRTAIKYDLTEAVKLICKVMRTQFADTQPFEVYAVACLLGIEDEAAHAARNCAATVRAYCEDAPFEDTIAGLTFTPRMRHISAGAYHRLVQFFRGSEKTPPMRFTDGKPAFHGFGFGRLARLRNLAEGGAARQADSDGETRTPQGRADKMQAYADITEDADTTLLSSDRVVFPVHSLVLRLASADKLLGGTPDSNGSIATHLDSATLSSLLSFCYPLRPFDFTDFSSVMKVYHAAHELQIQPVISAIRLRFKGLISSCPNLMSMYLIAAEQGWMEEAQEVAGLIADRGEEHTYAPEMDNACVSALAYYRLLKFCYKHNQALVSVIQTHTPAIDSKLNERFEGVQRWMTSIPLPVVEKLHMKDPITPSQWLDEGKTFQNGLKDALSKIQLETGPALDESPKVLRRKKCKK